MKKEHAPEQIRNSILGHLGALHTAGIKHTILPSRKKQVATTPITPAAAEKMDHINSLDALQKFIGECTRCKLCEARKTVVFGVGNPKASLMFVGEGPGADEDEQGVPFVGRAGQLLTKMIEAMGINRDDIYIANIVKCRPPDNRVPEPDEIATCIPFLMKQIELVSPKVIVCLGKTAVSALLNTQMPITKIRGQFQQLNGIDVMPTFHPAYLLRNPPMKKFAWEDLQSVMKKMGMKSKVD